MDDLSVRPRNPRLSCPPPLPAGPASRWAALGQAVRLPGTLLAIWRIVSHDFAESALDENLREFWGFQLDSQDPRCRARQWRKVRLSAIGPRDVVSLPVRELAFMMNVARELEIPIPEYSRHNGEGLRFLLPSLAHFMGMNREEASYAAAKGLSWCDRPWCAEERRHATTFARLIERLTETPPPRDNPNRPRAVIPTESDALRLLVNRQAAEWNSSSSYIVMAAHATGDLHTLIRNVACDEVKHLNILSAADQYLLGPRPWRRFADLVRHSLGEYRNQKRARSGGADLGRNPVTALEVIAAHILTECRMRKWLRGVPLLSLSAIFEAQPDPQGLGGLTPCVQREDRFDETGRTERAKRLDLARWESGRRRNALAQRAFEATHAAIIRRTLARELDGLSGAESPGSQRDRLLRRRIRRLGPARMRTALLGHLRDHEIRKTGNTI